MKYECLVTDINTQKKYIFTVYASDQGAALLRLAKHLSKRRSLKQLVPDFNNILIKEG